MPDLDLFGDDSVREEYMRANPPQGRGKRPEKKVSVADHLTKDQKKRQKADLNKRQRDWFESNGWTYAKVEHANAFGAVTVDLWGFADWLACHPQKGIMLVQTTSDTNVAARMTKSASKSELRVWLAAGGTFEVHGWAQPCGVGTRWKCRARVASITPTLGKLVYSEAVDR